MMRVGTVLALLVSLAGGAVTSQAPELAQQYRQRLNGALEELAKVVARFEEDAARHTLRLDEALAVYGDAEEPFLRDRGLSMRRVIERFERLEQQSVRLAELPPPLRPLAVFVNPDGDVLKGAMQDFEPAVPLTAHGMIWTASGLLAGFGLYKGLAFPFRRRRRAARVPGR
ncbi:DUF2937 family protein [Chelativorans salis]|uniref:DUF2937 family protein n=1 Tax=Chelativorans salis TaxID=2978478 RepID=A0ABT2LG79_9HYPH|nr:DUF2937 family protein [Chelativorans sp. EGI FJ00035]MCT7373475.1 DUF2937 family protein [Chelativorans sp. EGI FJ00035]